MSNTIIKLLIKNRVIPTLNYCYFSMCNQLRSLLFCHSTSTIQNKVGKWRFTPSALHGAGQNIIFCATQTRAIKLLMRLNFRCSTRCNGVVDDMFVHAFLSFYLNFCVSLYCFSFFQNFFLCHIDYLYFQCVFITLCNL